MVWAMFAMIFVRQCGSHTCCYSSKRYSHYPLLHGSPTRGLPQVVGASRSDAAVLMMVGQFADGISTTLLGLVADKLGRVPIFRWGDVGPDSYFNIYHLLWQKIRQEEESPSVWISVCVSLLSLYIQPSSGTDLRVSMMQ